MPSFQFLLQILCWFALLGIVYSYLLYPLLLALLCRLKKVTEASVDADPNRFADNGAWPTVSLVIAAYREQAVIAERIENALQLDYPAERLEILIGVDGDLDQTGTIVDSFDDARVKLVQFPERRGKASVLNDCIAQASGEVVLLSDANTFWDADAVVQLVQHFADQHVGCVCGRLVLTDAVTGKNVDGYYWRYENWIKEKEGQLGTLLGVNGAIYAIRRSLYEPIPANTIVDDFLIGMRVHQSRQAIVYEKRALAREETAPSVHDEFRRRVRIGTGNFQSLTRLWRLLVPDYGLVCWAYWSHKVLRWFCPLLMLVALGTSLILADQPIYYGLLLAQGLFYAGAIIGSQMLINTGWLGKFNAVPKIAWMFVMMNVALGYGLVRWLMFTQQGTWQRTERSQSSPDSTNVPQSLTAPAR